MTPPHPPFRRIAITARSELEGKEDTLQEIVALVRKSGAEPLLDPERCAEASRAERTACFRELKDVDLVIVLGGDGTTLRTVRELRDLRTPLLTVNRGTVGFLAECDTAEIETALPPLLRGEGVLDERTLLSCRVMRGATEIVRGIALNEVVVSQGAIARLIELKTSVGGEPLAVFRSDGLILATPTGSTAYSLSAGGPIVNPRMAAIILTPINAHAFTQKPLVIQASEEVTVEILPRESKFEDAQVSLTLDGQVHFPLERGDRVIVTEHPERVRFLRRERNPFFRTLREKMGWGA